MTTVWRKTWWKTEASARGLTFFFTLEDFGNGVVPVEDESVEAELVVQSLFRVLQREREKKQHTQNRLETLFKK